MNPIFSTLLSIFSFLLPHLQQITAEGAQVYHDIAQGEGGPDKIAKVASDLTAAAAQATSIAQQYQGAATVSGT